MPWSSLHQWVAKTLNFLKTQKYAIQDHITQIRQPYTVIEVGWWLQLSLPRVPSGRLDNTNPLSPNPATELIASSEEDAPGERVYMPSALTDLRDIGRFVARIVADDRTLNRSVFAYSECVTHRYVWDLVERVSGEKVIGEEVSSFCFVFCLVFLFCPALSGSYKLLPVEVVCGLPF